VFQSEDAQHDEAMTWLGHARALAARGSATPDQYFRMAGVAANTSFRKGEYDDALAAYRAMVDQAVTDFGEQSTQTSLALNNLGNVLEAQGDYAGAREVQERSLAIKREILGAAHPEYGLTIQNLGNLEAREGKWKEAMELWEQALAVTEAGYGPEHSVVGSLLTNLGSAAEQTGDLEKSIEYQTRALEIFRKTLPPEHPNIGVALTNLGAGQEGLGRHEEALDSHRQALKILEEALGPDHASLGFPLTGMGKAQLALGRTDEARAILERALALRVEHEPDPSAVADTRFTLARALWSDRRSRDRARSLAREALEGLRGAEGSFDKQSAEIQQWLDGR
jgi:tetratricopeptide (TPR) repeat protein